MTKIDEMTSTTRTPIIRYRRRRRQCHPLSYFVEHNYFYFKELTMKHITRIAHTHACYFRTIGRPECTG